MKNNLLSIIIVSLNDSKKFEITIKSILKQNIKNKEIILIDGGSNSANIDIINNYKKYLSVFISEKDQGIYDAMNKGIESSNGDALLFINCGGKNQKTVSLLK